MREPLHLSKGKTGAAIFACSREFCPLLRDKGHTGICIGHYCFDGALFAYLARRFKAHHFNQALARAEEVKAAGLDPKEQYLKEWFLSSQCTAH
eukprot:1075784-Lingulodinium_polyedra.AAC.1